MSADRKEPRFDDPMAASAGGRREPIPPSLPRAGAGTPAPDEPGPPPLRIGTGDLTVPDDDSRIVPPRRHDGVSALAIVAVACILVAGGGYFAWSHGVLSGIGASPRVAAIGATAATAPLPPATADATPATATPPGATATEAAPSPVTPADPAAARARRLARQEALTAERHRHEAVARARLEHRHEIAQREADAAAARHKIAIAAARQKVAAEAARQQADEAAAQRKADEAAAAQRKADEPAAAQRKADEAVAQRKAAEAAAQRKADAERRAARLVAIRKADAAKARQVARLPSPYHPSTNTEKVQPQSASGQGPPLDVTDLPPSATKDSSTP
jgi:hypothetical protein